MNWIGYGRMFSQHNLMYHPGICLDEQKKTTKNSLNRQYPDRFLSGAKCMGVTMMSDLFNSLLDDKRFFIPCNLSSCKASDNPVDGCAPSS
jgi:hypothetical protein